MSYSPSGLLLLHGDGGHIAEDDGFGQRRARPAAAGKRWSGLTAPGLGLGRLQAAAAQRLSSARTAPAAAAASATASLAASSAEEGMAMEEQHGCLGIGERKRSEKLEEACCGEGAAQQLQLTVAPRHVARETEEVGR
jgi:hypothetical protein